MPDLESKNKKSLQLDDKLFNLFNKLVPLVDNVSDGVRAIALLGAVVTGWLFIWMFFIQHFSAITALIVCGILFVPSLVLLRFWWALEDVKNLPDIAKEMIDDVTDEVKSTWKEVREDKKKALSFIGQAKNLWETKALLGQLDDVFSQYLNFGLLINPFSLLVAVLSLVAVLVLMLVGFGTVLTSIF